MPTKVEAENKEQTDVLIRLDKYFTSALDHPTWTSWRDNAVKCFKYKEGDQWTPAEKKELKKRSQPETVNNQVKVTIDRMVGQFVKQRTRIGYRGRNAQTDQPVADVLSDAFLFVKQNNHLEYEEREQAEDGFTCGMGVLETAIDFDDLLEPQIRIHHIDTLEMFPDPYSRRYDWNEDAVFICRAKWVDMDEAQELYPAKKSMIRAALYDSSDGLLGDIDSFKNSNYIDADRHRIRVVECWYKTKEKESILLMPDGSTQNVTNKKESEIKKLLKVKKTRRIDRLKHKMKMGMFSGGILFEHKEVDRDRFPYVPNFVHRKKSGAPYSLIEIALTMQDAINKRESKALHLLNTNQLLVERGTVRDKNEIQNEMARPDGFLEFEAGAISNKRVQIEKNIDLAVSQFNLHNEAKSDFRKITGVNPDALGERSEVRSGVGIARKQAMTDIIIAPVFDNLRRSRIILAGNVLELIQKYWTERKLFYITDDLNATRQVVLNSSPEQTEAIKQSIFDVVVDDLPDTTTLQQEQFQNITNILPQILPFGPFWTTLLFQMSDIRNKDEIVKQIQAASGPPPPDPKISLSLQWAEIPLHHLGRIVEYHDIRKGLPKIQ